MGLDMYARSCDPSNWDSKSNEPIEPEKFQEIKCWRKHYDLHEYMDNVWIHQHSNDKEFNNLMISDREAWYRKYDFNCKYLRLNKDDLLALKNYMLESNKNESVSKFDQDDIDFVDNSLKIIEESGQIIYYYSWA